LATRCVGWVFAVIAACLILGACSGGHVGGVLSGGRSSEQQWRAALSESRSSVLRVHNDTCDGAAVGTGWVVGPHTLVTNQHVVDGARQLSLETQDGRRLAVGVTRASSIEDLAVIHTDEMLPRPIPLADHDPVPGDLVRALGFPGGGQFTATEGRIVSEVDGERYGQNGRLLKASAEIHPGNSGGPLIDISGHAAGVVFAIDLEDGRALSIPVSRLRSTLSTQLPELTTSC
jgi:S1-C subfamily serine protease